MNSPSCLQTEQRLRLIPSQNLNRKLKWVWQSHARTCKWMNLTENPILFTRHFISLLLLLLPINGTLTIFLNTRTQQLQLTTVLLLLLLLLPFQVFSLFSSLSSCTQFFYSAFAFYSFLIIFILALCFINLCGYMLKFDF